MLTSCIAATGTGGDRGLWHHAHMDFGLVPPMVIIVGTCSRWSAYLTSAESRFRRSTTSRISTVVPTEHRCQLPRPDVIYRDQSQPARYNAQDPPTKALTRQLWRSVTAAGQGRHGAYRPPALERVSELPPDLGRLRALEVTWNLSR